jgi:hypothetical protein
LLAALCFPILFSLLTLGTQAQETVDPAIKAFDILKNKTEPLQARENAARYLGRLNPPFDAAIDALATTVQDKNEVLSVRRPGVNTLSRSGAEGNLLALHPTVKPVAMIADAILDCSAPGDIVLDNFSGVGSTILAAERVGRTCYAIESDPVYVDTTVKRWEKRTGKQPCTVRAPKALRRRRW